MSNEEKKPEPKIIVDNSMRWYSDDYLICDKCGTHVTIQNNGSKFEAKGEPKISVCPQCGAEYIYYKEIPRELEFEEWDGKTGNDILGD